VKLLKKIIKLKLIFLLYIFSCNAVINDYLFATVGNKAVTHSDIVEEVKIILLLNGKSFNEEMREQLEGSAVKSTIKRKIKEIEIEKYPSLEFNDTDLQVELNQLAKNIDMDLDTLKITSEINGIDFSNISEQVKIELMWNSLIFEMYKKRLTVNLEEIDEQLRSVNNKEEINEYLISEIIIQKVPNDELKAKIKEIKDKINVEGFKNVAMQLSISATSVKGGNLGWLNENMIVDQFKNAILNTNVGSLAEPVLIPEGILFFKVEKKRKSEKYKSLEDAKNDFIRAEKTKILNMYSLSHYDKLRRSVTINYR